METIALIAAQRRRSCRLRPAPAARWAAGPVATLQRMEPIDVLDAERRTAVEAWLQTPVATCPDCDTAILPVDSRRLVKVDGNEVLKHSRCAA